MRRVTSQEFFSRAILIHGNKYDYSKAIYKGMEEYIILKCNRCGLEFRALPKKHIYDKSGCPHCGKIRNTRGHLARRLSREEFIEKANIKWNNKYDYSKVVYKGTNIKVEIKCPCGNAFWQTPHNHLLGFNGCESCRSNSLGEEKIAKLLKEANIDFFRNQHFKKTGLLSYDFYLPKLNVCIEYNGIQHYKFCSHFHKNLHDFHKQKHHDWLKRKYCLENGIKLISIKFDENIKEKLGEIIG